MFVQGKTECHKSSVDLEHPPRDPENCLRKMIYQPLEARWGMWEVVMYNMSMDVPD